MTRPRGALLALGTAVRVGDGEAEIVRRAGTDERPILRLAGHDSRAAAEALRGAGPARAPRGGARRSTRTSGTPRTSRAAAWSTARSRSAACARWSRCRRARCSRSTRDGAGDLLVPLVRDAVRAVDVAAGVVDVDLAFLGEGAGAPATSDAPRG